MDPDDDRGPTPKTGTPGVATLEPMTANPRHRRRLAVWWHVVTSVGWMSMDVVMLVLLLRARAVPAEAAATVHAARTIDVVLLAPLASASAATGIVLGLGTPWGLIVHRWVLAKLVMTLIQVYLGIAVLSDGLSDAMAAVRWGVPPSWELAAGAGLMAGGLATQVWLSVAKPGGAVRRNGNRPARAAKPVPAPSWVLVLVVVGPMVDIGLGAALGIPLPVFSVLAIVVAALGATVARRAARRAVGQAPRAASAPPTPSVQPRPVPSTPRRQ